MPEAIDINVTISRDEDLSLFVTMAHKLGLQGMAVGLDLKEPIMRLDSGILLLKRYDLRGTTKENIRKQLRRVRHQATIVAAPLTNVGVANWAAEEAQIDVLTPVAPFTEGKLRESTAKLAASTGTALEIPIGVLLSTSGMARAKILKTFREAVSVALSARMKIVLSSGATTPLMMRAPIALRHIGYILGLDRHTSRQAVMDTPRLIVSENEKKLSKSYIADGIEVVREDGEK